MMPAPVPLASQTDSVGEHSSEAEYASFLDGLPMDASFRRKRLRYRAEFIARWPHLSDWFSIPLPERIGCLRGDKQAFPTYPLSFHARTYLYYLALTDRVRLDYDYLLAIGNMRVAESIAPFNTDFGLDRLVSDSIALGYSGLSMRSVLYSILPRLAMHTGVRSFDLFKQEHLIELHEAVLRFSSRDDVYFYRTLGPEFPRAFLHDWSLRIRRLQLLLYHRGNNVALPRISPDKRMPMPSKRPDLQQWADRWIAIKQQTLARTTTDHLAVSLRYFVEYLAQLKPAIRTFGDVTADHMTAFLNAMKHEIAVRTGTPLSITARRARSGAVARFLADGGAWGWPDFPARPVLDVKDLPRIPRRVPRFIPQDELQRLMVEIRNLPCPFQRAALLTARWSGARRGEIGRLGLDCLDRYPDGTARLRIPASKTMKERMVPLHEEAAEALLAVISIRKRARDRAVIDERTGDRVRFLFYRRGSKVSAEYLFQYPLKIACEGAGLTDGRGRPAISAHRFRHTVGTQLAERGAKLHTIMSVLGHQSPHMSMIYTRISDVEVLRDYQSVLGPGATIAGPGAEAIRAGNLTVRAIDWLKSNFIKTELELGHCLRLPSEGPCECDLYLNCAKFVTTSAYAKRLRERRDLELTLAEDARERAWPREVERHCNIAKRIEELLGDLREPVTV
jgi:integrase